MFFLFSLGQVTLKNVALKKPAYLSSVYGNNTAKNGVDGRIDVKMAQANGTYNYSNWFVVDLVHDYQVKYIILYNRPSCPGCGK